jgi:hypothetical protein
LQAKPQYRQARQFARLGVDIQRHSMWMGHGVAKALESRYKLSRMEIRFGPIINMGATAL